MIFFGSPRIFSESYLQSYLSPTEYIYMFHCGWTGSWAVTQNTRRHTTELQSRLSSFPRRSRSVSLEPSQAAGLELNSEQPCCKHSATQMDNCDLPAVQHSDGNPV